MIESVSCTKCHETFSTKDLMNIHQKEYNCQMLVICENCNNPVRELRYQMHRVSCKRLYISLNMMCKTFFRCFNKTTLFQYHLSNKHTAGGPLNCNMCEQTFADDKWVNKHTLKCHYTEYKCKQCSQLFSTRKILQNL